MNTNDAILLAAIGLMVYGIIQSVLNGLDFWLSHIGNVIGAIAITIVASAAYPLTAQDEVIVFVAVALGLYWFTKRKAKTAKRQTFEQVFETVEVEPIVEPKVEAEPIVEQFVEDEPVIEVTPEASPVFLWKGV